MFRWLALGLIAGNLVYAGWQLRPREPVSSPPAAAALDHSGIARLVLLKERPSLPRIGTGTGTGGDPGSDGQPAASPAEEVAPDSGYRQAIETADRRVADDETVGPGPVDPGSEPAAAPAPLCGVLGPFAEKISSRQVRDRLSRVDIPAEPEIREVVVREDHWVHISPLPSREAALDVLRALQQRRIDSFLITDGDLANGISLGIFSRQGSAQKLAARHESLGFDIAIRPLPRTEAQRWLVVPPEFAAGIDEQLLAQLRKGGIEMEFLRQPCADVAPAAQLD